MKNTYLYILPILLLFSFVASAQKKDTRTQVLGGASRISIAPDGKLWIIDRIGNIFHTTTTDSDWHKGTPIYKAIKTEDDYVAPHLDRLNFLNKNSAIVTGYITGKDGNKNNGYYYTENSGQTWELKDFPGNDWIYTVFVDSVGRAWMGGSSGDIFYSDSYGKNWQKLKSPYDGSSRLHALFMLDGKKGVSGALGNKMYITENNWSTFKRIATPADQKMYKSLYKTNNDDQINKVLWWQGYIIANQENHFFYTRADNIHWRNFPQKLMAVTVDITSDNLYAITEDHKAVVFTSPEQLTPINKHAYTIDREDIVAYNGMLYSLDQDNYVTGVSKNSYKHVKPYTADIKISTPRLVKQCNKTFWGANFGDELFRSDDAKNWYREATFDFYVRSITIQDDNSIILCDWNGKNHHYSLQDHKCRAYQPVRPLASFLASPIKSLMVKSGSDGCFSHSIDTVVYESALINDQYVRILSKILFNISEKPSSIPSISDFEIGSDDIQKYKKKITEPNYNEERYSIDKGRKADTSFYRKVPNMLDTLSAGTLKGVLDMDEGISSTTSNYIIARIINATNDTLVFYRSYYERSNGWHLPWTVIYKGLSFKCYDFPLSKFISGCLPDKFFSKEYFDNSVLIMNIADYMYDKKKKSAEQQISKPRISKSHPKLLHCY